MSIPGIFLLFFPVRSLYYVWLFLRVQSSPPSGTMRSYPRLPPYQLPADRMLHGMVFSLRRVKPHSTNHTQEFPIVTRQVWHSASVLLFPPMLIGSPHHSLFVRSAMKDSTSGTMYNPAKRYSEQSVQLQMK